MQENPRMTDAGGRVAWKGLAVTGGLLGALAASSCCILPIALFSLGAGGAWIGNLTAMAPYQPIFIVLALGFLAYGFWLVYWTPAAPCPEGNTCARPNPNRLVEIGLWSAMFVVAAALAFPFAVPVLLGD
jgi:mercuric ion transport protein